MAKPTYESLQKQIAKLQIKAKNILDDELKKKNVGKSRVLKLMKELGITAADLAGSKTGGTVAIKGKARKSATSAKRKPVVAKYRDPVTDDTWSGRGKTPRWLAAKEAAGELRDQFIITKS